MRRRRRRWRRDKAFRRRRLWRRWRRFRSVKRRLEVRAEVNGVTIIDDFAHHPTAIRETLRALRTAYPGRRLWAVLEPRSNTLRRNVFEADLVESLALADRSVLAAVFKPEAIAAGERLHPENVVAALRRARAGVGGVRGCGRDRCGDCAGAARGRCGSDPVERRVRRDLREAAAGDCGAGLRAGFIVIRKANAGILPLRLRSGSE